MCSYFGPGNFSIWSVAILLQVPLIRLHSMAIRPRRVLHRGPVASYCPVILHPEVSVAYWHFSSFLLGIFAGLLIFGVIFTGFQVWM